MTIGYINGHQIYKITKNEVGYNPTEFMKAYDSWEEGTKKSQLTDVELATFKEKYDSKQMTNKECIEFFGDLVKAGILTKVDAHKMYTGVTPIDVSNYDGTSRGTLSKWNGADPVRPPKGGFANLPEERNRGYSDFVKEFQQLKDSGANDIDRPYVNAYDGFLQIMEQLKREKIVNTY